MALYYEKINTLICDYQDLILENQMVLEELGQECQDKINIDTLGSDSNVLQRTYRIITTVIKVRMLKMIFEHIGVANALMITDTLLRL